MDLWLPEYCSDYLLIGANPNYCSETEWQNTQLVNRSGYQWVNDELDGETYFDILEHAGLDPVKFVQPVFDYLDDFR